MTSKPTKNWIEINGRKIGSEQRTYVIAEMSANHNANFEQALKILRAAKEAGADAVKLQTYTADTLTIQSDKPCFRIKGTLWNGKTLYDLFKEAYTPWDWQPKLKAEADCLGLDLFSSPFDPTAVDFLEKMNVPAYKVASFEIVDIPLIQKIARTGKPVIISTGMASLAEIEDAVNAVRTEPDGQVALLKCTSAYPADPADMNLRTIPNLASAFRLPVGLSDHTLGITAPVLSVALGASIIEKHFTLSRSEPGPDSAFSLEPGEFKLMVQSVREAEKALGRVQYEATEAEKNSRVLRRSLFFVKDVAAGELLTEANVRSIRPGQGLPPKFLPLVLGRSASTDVERGTPVSWDLISGK